MDLERAKENHVVKGANLLKRMGFREVSEVVKKHSLYKLQQKKQPKTWEEKIVFYADKRAKNDKIVSVEERFEYIKERYNREEIALTKKIER